MNVTRTKVLKHYQHFSRLSSSKRSFFASSTDHTTLLSNASVHCITKGQGEGQRQYILLPQDTPLDLAMKVDKLHLARLSVQGNIIYGPKVVQRTLGTVSDVCMPLLEAALNDISSEGSDKAIALASLQGLCQWVAKAIEENEQVQNNKNEAATSNKSEDSIQTILTQWDTDDQTMYEAVKAISTGIPRPGHSVVGQGTYRDGEQGWTKLAEIYVKDTSQGKLYERGGGQLNCIDYLADTTPEGLKNAGGSIARFQF